MKYPLPKAAVDAVLLTVEEGRLKVALHTRQNPNEPEFDKLALPGGLVRISDSGGPEDANLEAAVWRVLKEKTGFTPRYLEQLYVFSGRDRDPSRGWTLSLAYLALVNIEELMKIEGGVFCLYDVEDLPASIAFDHAQIIQKAVERIRGKARYSTLPCYFLPERFTLADLQDIYELLMQEKLDKSSFRRRVEAWDLLEPTEDFQRGSKGPPARYYRMKDLAILTKSF